MMKTAYVSIKAGPLEGHKYIVKSDTPILIGRSEEANIRIAYDQFCSRRHAKIFWDKNKIYITDFESTNGTLVNGVALTGTGELKNNDAIKLGETELSISVEDASSPGKSENDGDVAFDD